MRYSWLKMLTEWQLGVCVEQNGRGVRYFLKLGDLRDVNYLKWLRKFSKNRG